MAGKKEKSITFKCDEDFARWFSEQVVRADMSASVFIRQSLLLGAPLVNTYKGLDHLSLEDIREKEGGQ